MKITLKPKTAIKEIILSDEHAASSYGIPVAIVDGIAYGAGDELPIWPNDSLSFLHENAAQTVAAAVESNEGLQKNEKQFARKFYLVA